MPDASVQVLPDRPPPPTLSHSRSDDSPEEFELEGQPLTAYERRRMLMEGMAANARARHANRRHKWTLGLPWWAWAMALSGMCFLLFMGLWGIQRTGLGLGLGSKHGTSNNHNTDG